MSHAVMITTPAGNAMEGHGLTDARTILASDADLHPKRQGLSVTPRAVAYSVYCPATERYSLVTLDGRWIIPGREGYKTRGPVATYARKNIATVRPDALVILEPVRHNGPFKATQYGRRPGTCRQAIGDDWRGIYGYACLCGAGVQPEKVSREGWVIVRDGRGTHTVSYALRSEHRREFGTVPAEVPERANVVVAGAPEVPAVKAPATVDAPAESAPVADAPAVKAPAVHTPVKAPAQTPETAPEGTSESARRLISASETGRAYVTGNGERLRIESADGRMAYTLHTVHDEAHQEAKNGFAALAREFAGGVAKRGKGAPKWRKRPLGMWPGKPQGFKEFAPVDYAPGVMLAWTVDGVSYTGQVWANRIRSGKWNGDRGETSAVVVATVDGRRARRDEAVCLPFVHGSRRKNAYAFVCTDGGNADVSVIAAECAGDGLFDVVTPSVDVVDVWEGEGGAVAGVETPEPADAPADDVEPADAPAETATPEAPAGAHCHRCGTDTVFGAECRTCGRVDIVAALMPSVPVLCPAEEKAMATGRQYCPRCFTVGVALYATTLHTGPGYVCAECYTAHGRRLPEAGPAPVKAPAGDVIRAARAARKEAEESGASVGETHRAGEAARKVVSVAYGQRPADVISDPCSVDGWEDEGGACIGVDRPSAPDAGWGAVPVGTDPSTEIGTCTAPAVDVTPVRPDVVSDPGAVDTWDGEGGALNQITEGDSEGDVATVGKAAAGTEGEVSAPAIPAADADGGQAVRASAEADITIRHTRSEGTLVEGSRKGDGVYELIRPHGFRYFPSLRQLGIRQSRDKAAQMWKINGAAAALRVAGFTGAVEINEDERRSFAEAEAERMERAEERAERFEGYADNAGARSDAAWKRGHEIADGIPMGQPILVGHHSEGRARRDQERIHNATRTSIDEGKRAGYWAGRAKSAASYEAYRKNPGVTLRRIDKLAAQLRRVEKWQRGESAGGYTRALTPETVAELGRAHQDVTEELAYWRDIIAQAEAAGFKVWGKADFVKGDFVRHRGTWYEVVRVNTKSVSVPHIHAYHQGGGAGTVGGRPVVTKESAAQTPMGKYTWTAPYDDVQGRMSGEEMRARLAGTWVEPEPEETAAQPEPVKVPDVVSVGTLEVWGDEGGAMPGVETPRPVVVEVQEQQQESPTVAAGEGAKDVTGADPDPVAVLIASRNGSPTRARVLWWMQRHQAQRLCSDPRTNWQNSMLVWTADPGERGTDWDFVADRRPEETAALFAELFIAPMTWEAVQERRPGLCDPERWCNHAWPCGRDLEEWRAKQSKSKRELQRERQVEARARKAEARRAAEAAPCADCAGVCPVEARCSECRDRAAAGLPLVDVPRDVADEQVTECRALPASPVRKALEAGEREAIVTPYVPAPRVFEVAPVESPEVRQVRALVARLRAADDVEVVEEQAARNWFEAAVEPVAVVEDQEEHQDQDAPVLSWDEIAEELRELRAELKGDGQNPEDGPSLTWDEVKRELVALRREISPARPLALPVRLVRIPRRLRREALTIAASAALVTVAAGQVAEMMPYR